MADYFVRYVRLLKDSAGIDLYALGVQNEPAFQAAFQMCKMCPTVYRDVLKATGARFRQEGLGTRFFGCEHMAHSFGVYEGAIRADETISLPESSIVTLVAGAYRGTGTLDDSGVDAPLPARAYGPAGPANAVRMEILTLDGRRVGVFGARAVNRAPRRLPAGMYVRAFLDAHGRVVSTSRLTVDGR